MLGGLKQILQKSSFYKGSNMAGSNCKHMFGLQEITNPLCNITITGKIQRNNSHFIDSHSVNCLTITLLQKASNVGKVSFCIFFINSRFKHTAINF